jgi:hypothetical protein
MLTEGLGGDGGSHRKSRLEISFFTRSYHGEENLSTGAAIVQATEVEG